MDTARSDLDRDALARRWARAIADADHASVPGAPRLEFLRGLVDRVADALDAEPFDAEPGRRVGAELVEADLAGSDTLGRTIEILGAGLDRPGDGRQPFLLGALAEGFTHALWQRTLHEQEAIQGRLRHQALHDPLTGLPNRTLLFDRLQELFDAARSDDRVAVCYVDLDGFKAVNDSFGHDIGDELLVAVARRLHECVSRAGHFVARMGGDEFVILVHGHTAAGDAVGLAQAVLDALAVAVEAGGHRLTVSASIGIVDRPCGVTTPAELMRAADITLYWAKAEGKRRWALFDSARTDREVARYELSAAMPGALRRGEFVLEYQPLVLCGGETVIGAEALVRWLHPRLGRLAPDRFVGLAEETGMIVPLGLWVLEEACRQGRRWRDLAGDAAPLISVNLAVRQAQEPALVDDVAAILERTGLEPAYLQLELTESALIGPGHEPLAALTKLAAMGVRIAIDDFGTGYSNLTYLRTLPVQAIKLAGSFVDGLRTPGRRPGHADLAGERMVATLVQLAHALDLTVTAEGVETQVQADRLRAVGCDSGQGFYYAPPGPPERITEMITSG
ncbi:EAL domain-containing protein [Planosporangium flavigriseum]|nr:EAL domain-containing protein [Planosporangium flavigriseum]NJC65070.1 EAL domain-containing protein [Planosporangium flavigriseum]